MIQRCTNPNVRAYKDYGGRGITVCQRWRESFANFLADIGEKPEPELTLERRHNDKGYSKGNCYWATRETQAGNKRFPVGVLGWPGVHQARGKYAAQCRKKYLGVFDTPEQACWVFLFEFQL